jgi:hypothetical protein
MPHKGTPIRYGIINIPCGIVSKAQKKCRCAAYEEYVSKTFFAATQQLR